VPERLESCAEGRTDRQTERQTVSERSVGYVVFVIPTLGGGMFM